MLLNFTLFHSFWGWYWSYFSLILSLDVLIKLFLEKEQRDFGIQTKTTEISSPPLVSKYVSKGIEIMLTHTFSLLKKFTEPYYSFKHVKTHFSNFHGYNSFYFLSQFLEYIQNVEILVEITDFALKITRKISKAIQKQKPKF